MQIDVIIATYNRASLLGRSVESILDAPRDPRFDFVITLVDNRSNDETPQVIAHLIETAQGRVRGLYEPRPGKSHAVNTGIAVTTGDVLVFADDDQVMSPGWLAAIHRTLQEDFDFVSG